MAGSDTPRILLLGGDGARSGVPRHLEQLTETLCADALLTVVSDRNLGGYDRLRGIRVNHIEVDGLRSSLHPVNLWRGWRGGLRVARGTDWDMIWLHARLPALMLRLALVCGLLRVEPRTAIVLSYHGIPFDSGHRRMLAWLSRRIERLLLAHCPQMHLICLTPGMAARLRDAVGPRTLARHHLHVLPNSSNLGALPASGRDVQTRRLVVTGRAGYQKNYPLAARLMEHLPSNYTLTLCGPGTDDGAFQARVLRGLSADTRARIRFAGPVADVRPILAEADGYLLTSRYEGLPIGAIEAFECGLPLILGAFETAPEMIAPHPMARCLAFRDLAQDAHEIATLIETYTRDRDRHAARIRAAWRRTYRYDIWQSQVRSLARDILSRPRIA